MAQPQPQYPPQYQLQPSTQPQPMQAQPQPQLRFQPMQAQPQYNPMQAQPQAQPMQTQQPAYSSGYQPAPAPGNASPSNAVMYQPQVQPAVQVVATPTTNLPFIAFVWALVTVLITLFCCVWLPGLFCLVPAMAISISGMNRAETGKVASAKKFSYVSLALIMVFYVSFPILVTAVTLAGIYGSIEANRSRYYYSYYY